MKKKIALVGVGGNFFDIIEEIENRGYDIAGYINNKKDSNVKLYYLGDDSVSLPNNVFKIITVGGIGKKIELRKRLYKIHKDRVTDLFFEDSNVSRYVIYKENSGIIIFKNNVIKAGCILGENVFINSGCVIGHHANIGNHTQMSLGVLIGGNAVIGESCYIGMGAKIFEGVKIGNNCVISANALVTKDMPGNSFIVERNKIIRAFSATTKIR